MTNSQLLLTYMQKSLSVSVCTSQQNKKEGFSVMQCCLTAALLFSSSTFEYAEALEERRTTFPGGLVRKEILLVCDAWTTTSSWALREATSDLCSYDYFLLRGGEPECVCLISACVCVCSCNASYRRHTHTIAAQWSGCTLHCAQKKNAHKS